MIEEKYPVKNTGCPTVFDKIIAEKAEWLRNNDSYFWKKAQSAPSELSFKIYMFSHIHEDYIREFTNDIANEILSSFKTQAELYDHPDISLDDLEWCLVSIVNTPSVVKIISKIDNLKKEHNINNMDMKV